MAAEIIAHCMKCKDKRTMANPEVTVTKNGRKLVKGTCPECGTTICKFVPASAG